MSVKFSPLSVPRTVWDYSRVRWPERLNPISREMQLCDRPQHHIVVCLNFQKAGLAQNARASTKARLLVKKIDVFEHAILGVFFLLV